MYEIEISEICQKYAPMLQKVSILKRVDRVVESIVSLQNAMSILLLFPLFPFAHRYENLKGKYFEIKRAQMNGEQRPYWLYYNEMDYIISHFPGHRPRINLDASNSVSATSTPNSASASLDGSTTGPSNSNQTEFADIKPTRSSASIAAVNMDASKLKF